MNRGLQEREGSHVSGPRQEAELFIEMLCMLIEDMFEVFPDYLN